MFIDISKFDFFQFLNEIFFHFDQHLREVIIFDYL